MKFALLMALTASLLGQSSFAKSSSLPMVMDCSGETAQFDEQTGQPVTGGSWMARTCKETYVVVSSVTFSPNYANTLVIQTVKEDEGYYLAGQRSDGIQIQIFYNTLKGAQLAKAYFDRGQVVAVGFKNQAGHVTGDRPLQADGTDFVIRYTGALLK